jgi:hypothetical protein
MRTSLKIGVYALGLLVTFGAALGAGAAVGAPAGAKRHGMPADSGHAAPAGSVGPAHPPAGLQVSQDGYRLQPLTAALTPGPSVEFAFRVLGPDGHPVTRYTPTHERDLHLIVVRRDLSGFQHVHPSLGADGTWRIPLTVAAAGQYRLFADFRPAARAEAITLGVDVPAPGNYAPTPLPPVSRTATVDGYTVELAGELVAGTASRLAFRVSRDGRPVTDVQPYLGAYGHLVTLREGDLAYLHTHPDGVPGDGHTAAGPEVVFHVEVPAAGTYRLYLDFQHQGVVHTAEFTATAGHG